MHDFLSRRACSLGSEVRILFPLCGDFVAFSREDTKLRPEEHPLHQCRRPSHHRHKPWKAVYHTDFLFLPVNKCEKPFIYILGC